MLIVNNYKTNGEDIVLSVNVQNIFGDRKTAVIMEL